MTINCRRVWIALLVGALGAPGFAQDPGGGPDEKKEPDPKVKEKLQALSDAVGERDFSKDAEAAQIIDELTSGFLDMHPKDKTEVIKSFDKIFMTRKRPADDLTLYRATVFALGKIGRDDEDNREKASKTLEKWVDKKPFDEADYLTLQQDMLENIGVTRDQKQIEMLLKRATRDPVDGIKQAAGKALRHFSEAEGSLRKQIVNDLLIDYGKIEGEAKGSVAPGNEISQTRERTLRAIADPWNTTLAAMSGQSFGTAEQWIEWWNESGKKDTKLWK